MDSKLSEAVTCECGVFQGAPLGPLLFIIYINDIANLLVKNGVFYNIYADDTVIVSSDVKDINAISMNQRMLQLIEEWCDVNKIILNQKYT